MSRHTSTATSTAELMALGAAVVLRDGSSVRLRRTIEIEVPLPVRGLAPALQKLLALCARAEVTPPAVHRETIGTYRADRP